MKSETLTIKIIIADDHAILRDGLVVLFGKYPWIAVVGEAANGAELIALTRKQPPDVIITDVLMPQMDGIEATRILTREFPAIGVIALSSFDETHLIVNVVDAGARGYLLKSAGKAEMLKAIEVVYEGGTYYTKMVADKMVALAARTNFYPLIPNNKPIFSRRELEVMQLMCQQLSSKEIGDKLGVNKNSIDSYRERIQQKIGAKNMIGIVLYAIKNGIYTIN